jgi:hypothetical protein
MIICQVSQGIFVIRMKKMCVAARGLGVAVGMGRRAESGSGYRDRRMNTAVVMKQKGEGSCMSGVREEIYGI